MTYIALLNAILHLEPEASFSIWAEEPPFPPEADTSTDRLVRFGLIVCWAKSNPRECPSEHELSQLYGA